MWRRTSLLATTRNTTSRRPRSPHSTSTARTGPDSVATSHKRDRRPISTPAFHLHLSGDGLGDTLISINKETRVVADRPQIRETVSWLRDRTYYLDQIREHTIFEGQSATTASLDLSTAVQAALSSRGIDTLYEHQVRAIQAVRNGSNTVVATPTASGKSLTYVVPALERAVESAGKTLYIAPYRALINDQTEMFRAVVDELGSGATAQVGVQTGETDREARRAVKQAQPDVLLTTLDQVHLSVVPYGHSPRNWKWLFQQLDTVVIDEVHMYRGYFGSHAALVFRRLNRLCEFYDADPEYICCSATIGNPVEHAAAVTGQPEPSFTLVDEDTSVSGDQHWVLWNPPRTSETARGDETPSQSTEATAPIAPDESTRDAEPPLPGDEQSDVRAIPHQDDVVGGERRSHHRESIQLFCDLVQRGYQTLVFTTARQGAAQYAGDADRLLRARDQGDLADCVSAYHAGLDDGRREELEHGLRTGDTRGVWSTTALELGIDIGTLDVVVLDGYPGTTMSTFQRAGRAGRGDDPSLVILVGGDDPLDQYVMRDPGQLFDGGAERATINPRNDTIRPDHVVCAADDSYLDPSDEAQFGDDLPAVVRQLETEGRLARVGGSRVRWEAAEDNPQWNTAIRGTDGREIVVVDRLTDESLERLDFRAAARDAHPDALYTHRKQTYRVAELDLDRDTAVVEPVETVDCGGVSVPKVLAQLTVSEQVTGYLYHENLQDDSPTEVAFEEPLPPATIETTGLVVEFPAAVSSPVRERGGPDGLLDALHAVEHALISVFPRTVLCDRADIGGLSTIHHPQTTGGTIFVHDGYDGGAGYCRAAYDDLQSLVDETQRLIGQCECAEGCPSCIHSPHCGNANRSLDKQLGVVLLAAGVD